VPKGLAGDRIEGKVEFSGGGHGGPAARGQAQASI
jgi:hypothetical protein